MQPSPFVNPLATVAQLEESGSRLDGIPSDLEDAIRFAGASLTQAAGVLLRLPQEVIAQAIVVFMRFWVGAEGGSLVEFGAKHVSAASMYLAAKLSAYPKSPRSVVNVYAFLDTLPSPHIEPESLPDTPSAEDFHVTEGTYQARKAELFEVEQRLLKVLGFQVHVALPYTLCITYLQVLVVFSHPRAREIAKRAFAHMNTALLSPQLLYLTHQPPSIATAAIYLAAKEVGIKLPDVEWWEVFDTDREELGFLVVAMLSVEGFAEEMRKKWGARKVPMSVEELLSEMKRTPDDSES